MDFVCATAEQMQQALYRSLAGYRHQVFVERLGWELPSQPGYEQDQFDRADTVHVVARNAAGQIVGCGRLLPTSGPYLLGEVFPHLLNGMAAPHSDRVWELSRFAAMSPAGAEPAHRQDYVAERVLLQALRHCAAHGVTQLVAVSTPPVERLLLRAGVHCQRLGPPDMAGGKPVIAFVIAVDEASISALTLLEAVALSREAVTEATRSRVMSDALRSLQALAHEDMDTAADAPAPELLACPDLALH
jgi:N-acyl-L-homoserine lactone synthetase